MIYTILFIGFISYVTCNPIATTTHPSSSDDKLNEESPLSSPLSEEQSPPFVPGPFRVDGISTFDSPVYEVSHGYAQKEEHGRNREDYQNHDEFRWFAPTENDERVNIVEGADEETFPGLFPSRARGPVDIW